MYGTRAETTDLTGGGAADTTCRQCGHVSIPDDDVRPAGSDHIGRYEPFCRDYERCRRQRRGLPRVPVEPVDLFAQWAEIRVPVGAERTGLLMWGVNPDADDACGPDVYHALADPDNLASGSGPSLCGVDIDAVAVVRALQTPPTMTDLCPDCTANLAQQAAAIRRARAARRQPQPVA